MKTELAVLLIFVGYSAGAAINSTTVACARNEVYVECGSVCAQTCGEPEPQICPEMCVSECVCREGFIRQTEGGRCIPRSECALVERCTKRHQVYSECASACPTTCQRKPRVCIEVCRTGCVCERGYILDEISGNCVGLGECPI